MGYLRRTSNYLERTSQSYLIDMKSMVDPIAICAETLRIDCRCFLEKEFTKLIHTSPCVVLYLTDNQVDSCHSCVCDPLT